MATLPIPPLTKSVVYQLDRRSVAQKGPLLKKRPILLCRGSLNGDGTSEDPADAAMKLPGYIPDTSDEFLKRVSSKAYDMRRSWEKSVESYAYDVVESNPFPLEDEKPLYVLAKREDRLYTMRTRRARSEVESELGKLFPASKWKSGMKNIPSSQQSMESRFRMHVEDIREGVLVFEDEETASEYCSLLEDHGHQCLGTAKVSAKEVFSICRQSNSLAVLFRRGINPPTPDNLRRNLRAKNKSLED